MNGTNRSRRSNGHVSARRLVDEAATSPLWHADPQWAHVRTAARDDRPPVDPDVLVVGAGFSGLWIAHTLRRLRPDWSVAIVDATGVGAGASSRNGGWCSAVMPMSPSAVARKHGTRAARDLYREAIDNVGEIGEFVARHAIDCDWRHGGTVVNATHPAQESSLRTEWHEWVDFGFGDEVRWLDASALRSAIEVAPTFGGYFQSFCASMHPVRFLAGLTRAVLSSGATIHAPVRVTSIDVGRVDTDSGVIRPRHVVRATEAFTPSIRQYRRDVLPVYSLMIATEPLPGDVLASLSWSPGTTFTDGGELVVYAQLTPDGRLAFGGRGARTPYASRPSEAASLQADVHARLVDTMHEFFPATRDVRISHRWGGAVAAHRTWWPAAVIDQATSDREHTTMSIGGYVGDGVATSHMLARRAAQRLVDPTVTRHVLVPASVRRWEPEPLRYVGANAMISLIDRIDAREARRGRPSRLLRALLGRIIGK
jgi:glycine/D-amino acid oxidase-like deaminating enzyme